jgi:hypothetical protein
MYIYRYFRYSSIEFLKYINSVGIKVQICSKELKTMSYSGENCKCFYFFLTF